MTLRRFLTRWGPVNITFAALALYGGLAGAGWAANIVVVMAWVMATGMMLMLFTMELCAHITTLPDFNWANIKATPPDSLPRFLTGWDYWLDVAFDIAIITFLASVGWHVTAVVYALHTASTFFARRAMARIIERHRAWVRTRTDTTRYHLEMTPHV